jgi:arsenate reductase (thioredoxin)
MKKTVLFLCTANSARSQLAEGLLNHFQGDRYQAVSAGTRPGTLHPLAITVMNEIGIDISGHHSKPTAEFKGQKIDTVVTVCDNARENCPYFPGAESYLHCGFPDPVATSGTEEERLTAFRTVRDAIREWLDTTFATTEPALRAAPPDLVAPGIGMKIGTVTHLSPAAAQELCRDGAVIVDLREVYETNYRVFAVPEVIYLPKSRFRAEYAILPANRPLILADAVGLWSKDAIAILQDAGYRNLANLAGGIIDWEKDGQPTRKDLDYELGGQCACKLKPRKGRNPLQEKP